MSVHGLSGRILLKHTYGKTEPYLPSGREFKSHKMDRSLHMKNLGVVSRKIHCNIMNMGRGADTFHVPPTKMI